ncbi:hypothetical protein EC957_006795 [Mortierella hygrophila]|uniref:BZIP domain-containing protein n=1 Tax=Mortierella hygrophila TaxID=979708 RepID=A0A9P6FE03_9FUNG|nr:hypothetical protein EC957_006795 [Mortierella hygrophila]
MSLEAEIRRDTANLTPTRFLLECDEISFGLNFENSYSPFDASCKYLTNSNSNSNSHPFKTDVDFFNSDNRNAISSAPIQHPWSDMVFDESYLPMRPTTPAVSPPSSTSSFSSSSGATSQSFYPSSNTSPIQTFHPRMMSITSDHLISHPEASHTLTHEYHAFYDKLIPSKKSYHSDQDLPRLSPDSPFNSPSPDSLVPTGIFRNNSITMANPNQTHDSYPAQQADVDNNDHDSSDDDDQDMSDVDNNGMDVDSNKYNDDHDEQDTATSPSSQSSRDPSAASESPRPKMTRTRSSKRAAAVAAASAIASKSDSKPSSKASTKSKRASTASKSKGKGYSTAATNNSDMSTKNVGVAKTLSQLRKHSASVEESPEAKRQKFLERNRMAASKCREKKRLQTLKTIGDADVITARNQALHETLDELQEEVRTLKNMILCHRDCGCDVIQKFVQSSFNVPSVRVQAPPSQSYFKRF